MLVSVKESPGIILVPIMPISIGAAFTIGSILYGKIRQAPDVITYGYLFNLTGVTHIPVIDPICIIAPEWWAKKEAAG